MDLGIAGISLAVGAGLASVLSPCVLPVVPVIVAGAEKKDRLRPLLIVTGLAMTFMIMGALSALFGSFLAGRTRLIEQAGGAVILLMGIMVIFHIILFKMLYRLSNLRVSGDGRIGGFVLGMALGVVWVPCVGPLLSSILAMVGTGGQVGKGVLLLAFYSLGFAVPMLAVAYSSHLLQRRLAAISRHGALMRHLSGGVLVAFGVYTVLIGNFAF